MTPTYFFERKTLINDLKIRTTLDIKSLLTSLCQREVEATLREDSLREIPSLAKRGEGRFSKRCNYNFETLNNYFQNVIKAHLKIALFLDFDGTLVPIQKNPSQCFLPDKTKKQLRSLADSNHCYVTVLSGRSLSDIRKRVGIKKIYYGGNHGIDIIGHDLRYTHPKALSTRSIIRVVKERLKRNLANIEGAWIEDKKFTISLHFRSVKTADISHVKKVFYNVMDKFLEEKILTVIKGKKVLELMPDISWNKGNAALWILQRLKGNYLPIYVGDDLTDENAFKALSKKGITICVGKSKKTLANYYLKGQWEAIKLLQFIEHCTNLLKRYSP